jgi:hypothetical protein
MSTINKKGIIMKTHHITLTKIKQIIHAYIPLIFLFILPKSLTTVIIAGNYIVFTGYFYLKKMEQGLPDVYWEYYLINSVITLFFVAAYTEGC